MVDGLAHLAARVCRAGGCGECGGVEMNEVLHPGKFYVRPAIFIFDRWFPVYGEPHADPEIAAVGRQKHLFKNHPAAEEHWHYDWRFMSDKLIDLQFRSQLSARGFDYPMQYVAFISSTQTGEWETAHKRFKCFRLMPEFPLSDKFSNVLETICIKKKVDLDKMICPHKGFSLRGLPINERGCIVCPGHGCMWDAKTGEMVSRREQTSLPI